MITHKVTCDSCERDITTSSNSVDYRIVLMSEGIPSTGGAVTDMWIEPQFRQPLHFCGINCLKQWLDKFFGA